MAASPSDKCDHQWTDYGTLKSGDNPRIEIEACVRCGVQRQKGGKPESYDLDDEFEKFMRRCFPKVKEHERQYFESRRIFIAGIASCYFYTISLAAYDVETAELELRKLQEQITEFFTKKMGFNQ